MPSVPKVAIACQGGGSHAAFVAGILLGLLKPAVRSRYELVALSGHLGGAMCASLAWAGLLSAGPDEASRRLREFWRDVETHDLVDTVANFWSVFIARLPVAAEVSPYLYAPVVERRLREFGGTSGSRTSYAGSHYASKAKALRRCERRSQRRARRLRGRNAELRRSHRFCCGSSVVQSRARGRAPLLGRLVYDQSAGTRIH